MSANEGMQFGGAVERLVRKSQEVHVRFIIEPERCCLHVFGVLALSLMFVVVFSDTAYAYSDERFKTVCQKAMDYLEGGFGTLLTAVAGMGAIVASAMGGFKTAWALLVVAIGSFILRNFIIGAEGTGAGFFDAGSC